MGDKLGDGMTSTKYDGTIQPKCGFLRVMASLDSYSKDYCLDTPSVALVFDTALEAERYLWTIRQEIAPHMPAAIRLLQLNVPFEMHGVTVLVSTTEKT